MEITLPDFKDVAKSKTIAGIVLLVVAIVANSAGYIESGPWFQAIVGASLALAGFGIIGVIKKVIGPLHKIAEILPAVEKAAGLPGTDVSKVKVDTKSLGSKGALTGFVGLIAVIVGHMLGYVDDATYEAGMGVSAGLVGIGGRVLIQKIIIIVTRLLAALPTIEAAIEAFGSEEESNANGEPPKAIEAKPQEPESNSEDVTP